jgi:DNA-3-methyladenine glycosylase I
MEAARGPDGQLRCPWGLTTAEYLAYHDHEWGRPVKDDRQLFEKLCLESFQSGLSWLTILRKRPAFRAAFHDFDIERVAAMGAADVERLLTNPGIIRHRGKIESTINNAAMTLALQEDRGSLAAFIWSFEPSRSNPADARTTESTALSKALKARGFTWTGPTTMYALMQAMGVVNDHLDECHTRLAVEEEREAFVRP